MVLGRFFQLIKRERTPILGLLAAWAVFFAPMLSGKFVYFLDDLKIIYFPLEVIYGQVQTLGQLPVWNTLFGFGHPLLSWGQLGFFTPVHVALRSWAVNPLNVLQISVAVYYALGLVSMYGVLRSLRLAQGSSFIGALVFTFSGFHLGHLNHVNFYTGTMLLPLLLLAVLTLIRKPQHWKILGLSLVASAITLSAQPQIVLYVFAAVAIIAGVYALYTALQTRPARQWYLSVITSVAVAALLSFCLSSFAILPLAEFLPLTERDDALPESVLFEFSYPPLHAITLIVPYFFGDHEMYWGAKGFQELGAFVGLIPLFLASLALTSWRSHGPLRLASVLLLVLGVAGALGQYSPLYRWLVEEKIVTTLAIPGRFVFFALLGLGFLAALGFEELLQKKYRPGSVLVRGAIVPLVSLSPFVWWLTTSPTGVLRLRELLFAVDLSVLLAVVAGALICWFVVQQNRLTSGLLLTLVAVTLVGVGMHYNPLSTREAVTTSPFTTYLNDFSAARGTPARLYSRDELIGADNPNHSIATDHIGPAFSIYQPISLLPQRPACLQLPVKAQPGVSGTLVLGFHDSLTGTPLEQQFISSNDALVSPNQTVCFSSIPSTLSEAIISITSGEESGMTVFLVREEAPSAYLVRVARPTAQQLSDSHKPRRVVIQPALPLGFHEEPLLARHLQVTANTSSARWIGSLSIRPYREFIEFFFANDREPLDGDGNHVLVENREMVDFAGITHVVGQAPKPGAPDQTSAAGYDLVAEEEVNGIKYRLYENPMAFPKAFTVNRGEFKAVADETRLALTATDYDPREMVYITGPAPPPKHDPSTPVVSAAETSILSYTDRRVDVAVSTPHETWLIVTDSTTPQWHTFIDDQPAPQYVANTIFKAAQVPTGDHVVSFRYSSPAVERAHLVTRLGLAGVVLLFSIAWWRTSHAKRPSP